jgi:catecholate siderophore receptor
MDESEISATLGSYRYRRITGDFNIRTGESAGLRINAMATQADSNGAGASLDKRGVAASYRFGSVSELKTTVRSGKYTRDQGSGAIRFCQNSVTNPTCPIPLVALDTINSTTVLTRGNSNKFTALGLRHEVLAGVDLVLERKRVYSLSAVTKPNTTIGTIDDGASVIEASQTQTLASAFQSNSLGLYAQDLLQAAPDWKLLGGLRFDQMRGTYDNINAGGTASSHPRCAPALV